MLSPPFERRISHLPRTGIEQLLLLCSRSNLNCSIAWGVPTDTNSVSLKSTKDAQSGPVDDIDGGELALSSAAAR
jgi:hypothetical protein